MYKIYHFLRLQDSTAHNRYEIGNISFFLLHYRSTRLIALHQHRRMLTTQTE